MCASPMILPLRSEAFPKFAAFGSNDHQETGKCLDERGNSTPAIMECSVAFGEGAVPAMPIVGAATSAGQCLKGLVPP